MAYKYLVTEKAGGKKRLIEASSPANAVAHVAKVVLTTAHLNHTPEDCRDEVLKAMCQRCHLAHDRDYHAASRRKRAEDRKASERAKVLNVAAVMAFQFECLTGRRTNGPSLERKAP